MSTITYDAIVNVYLSNRLMGYIGKYPKGWQYLPNGVTKLHPDNFYTTLEACKASLEGE